MSKRPEFEFVVSANGREKVVTADRLRARRVLDRCIRRGMSRVSLSRRPRHYASQP